jgi:hypothetical protein
MTGEGVLVKPKCRHCGFRVPNDTVVGASCPKCARRFLPERESIAAGAGAEELEAKDAELATLRTRVAELEGAEEGEGDAIS